MPSLEFQLPHNKFLGEKDNVALRRLRENLAVLEAWLLKSDLRRQDLKAISDQVARFRDTLGENEGAKARQPEPEVGKLCELKGVGPKNAIRSDLASLLRGLATSVPEKGMNGTMSASFGFRDFWGEGRPTTIRALYAVAEELDGSSDTL